MYVAHLSVDMYVVHLSLHIHVVHPSRTYMLHTCWWIYMLYTCHRTCHLSLHMYVVHLSLHIYYAHLSPVQLLPAHLWLVQLLPVQLVTSTTITCTLVTSTTITCQWKSTSHRRGHQMSDKSHTSKTGCRPVDVSCTPVHVTLSRDISTTSDDTRHRLGTRFNINEFTIHAESPSTLLVFVYYWFPAHSDLGNFIFAENIS